ncbi:MAG: thioesterase [Glaciimonas sp.]|nr:thioesterase [Glaciimonas sp.]
MEPSPWFVKLGDSDSAGLKLFVFPYSGGSAVSYARWRKWLPAEMELHGVQLPGRGQRMAAPLVSDMDQLIAQLLPDLLPRLDQPYLLYGHSNGALMAFAVLNRLLQEGVRRPEAVILSGSRSPTVPWATEHLSALSDEQLLQKLKDLNGTPPALLEDMAIMRMFFPAIRADFAIGESHVLRTVHPALRSIPALILAGEDDHIAMKDVFSWTDLFADGRTMSLSGDHFFIHSNPAFAHALREFCQLACAAQSSLVPAES